MAGVLFVLEQQRLIDNNGVSSGGQIFFYQAGTSIKAPIYQDIALTIPMTNPVVVNLGGSIPSIYLNPAIAYRRSIVYADGSTDTVDPYQNFLSYTAAGTGSVAQTLAGKAAQYASTAVDFGAPVDGSTSANAGIAAVDALGKPFVMTPGLYYISSNLTIANRVVVQDGARFVISNGATLTFSKGIDAGQYQIFNLVGTGAVAGLIEAWFEWFANDYKATGGALPSVDCRPKMDAFAAALNVVGVDYITLGGSLGKFGAGTWLISGATPSTFHNCSIRGAGSGQTNFLWSTSATAGFIFIGNRAEISGFQFDMNAKGIVPTSGIAITTGGRNHIYRDVIVNNPYQGWEVTIASSTNTYWHCNVYSAAYIGIHVLGQEQHFHDCHVVSIDDWATITGMTATFSLGDNVSVSNSTGVITGAFGGGSYKIAWVGNRPSNGVTITDATSGATGTLALNTPPHSKAALFWETTVAGGAMGNVTHDGDIIGGDWGLYLQGAGSAQMNANNPAFDRSAQNFCVDTTYFGSKADKIYGCEFRGWFSSSRNLNATGFVLTNSCRVRFNCQFVNNGGQGLMIMDSNIYVQVIGCEFDGNCHNIGTTAAMAELALVGTLMHDIQVIGGTMGFPDLYGRTPNLGLYMGKADSTTGATAYHTIFSGINVAFGKSSINATNQDSNNRIMINSCTGMTNV